MSWTPVARIATQLAHFVTATVRDLLDSLRRTVTFALISLESWMLGAKHAQYGLAVTRMLLGTTILGFALTNWSTRLYTFGSGAAWSGQLEYPTSEFVSLPLISLFHDASSNDILFTTLYVVLMMCAALFIVGYRTRLVSIPLFVLWVGLIETNEYVSDQSDNLTRICLILLFFAAPAERWSVDAARRKRRGTPKRRARARSALVRWWRFQTVWPTWWTNLLHNAAIVALSAQVFFIYVAGGLYKAQGAPWAGGWAIYDPIHTQQFGTWPELSALVTTWGPLVALMTTLTVLVQIGFPLLLLRRCTRILALMVVLCFHFGIALLMGLPWFSLAMVSMDAIFIRDVTWSRTLRSTARRWTLARPDRASVA